MTKPGRSRKHELHLAVGRLLTSLAEAGSTVVLDVDCGGDQHVPLFCTDMKGRGNQYCKVDALVFSTRGVQVVLEIEESNLRPTQVCGKLLTTALAESYSHRNHGRIPMCGSVLFVQVLDSSRLKPNSAKLQQWGNLTRSLKRQLPLRRGSVTRYYSIQTSARALTQGSADASQLLDVIRSHLRMNGVTTPPPD